MMNYKLNAQLDFIRGFIGVLRYFTLAVCAAGVAGGEATTAPRLVAGVGIKAARRPAGAARAPAGRPALLFVFSLTNTTALAVAPQITASKLLVNGQELKDWDLTIRNGPRDARWSRLEPGQVILFSYDLSEHFRKVGVYKIVWKGAVFETSELQLAVSANGEWSLKKSK